ncbi:anhydro-N-acetylmuramic acid kinase [Lentzea sp. BCCO 10_0061]|uniref:Anhydro-N-acetylmuramic acid kinase n=1 Tax=Lentzea sokolovensis TaxID=3095429 RepID=A0ABU4V106_9PSEU|nr:anhydro-N-acetylmuramic acid kinase [Lentzea sp. BCCO 10_0061]MDX8145451.1 anhydro-N-acetylmuramic acid kinase [Lentzea sp. BCCO 10_0061]
MIGLISGTSMDGIDVAVADLSINGDVVELVPVQCAEHPFPKDLLEKPRDLAEVCAFDTSLGQAFGEVAAGYLPADLISSLGQTVHHEVQDGDCLGTLQLGQPAWIAERTGVPVVADLRVRDVAAGGQGAPLASTLDALWLAGMAENAPAIALNIGGIANITVVRPGSQPIAYDTGPGNALMDAVMEVLSNGERRQDTNGEFASRGTVREDVLKKLLADPYYAKPWPKSTGKEHFNAEYLQGFPTVQAEDMLRTLAELTARTIADACRAHDASVVVASGGGMRNPVLVEALTRALDPIPLKISDSLGLPRDGKEAYLAALLGFLTWHGIAGNTPSATGASGPRLLGSITPGNGPLRMPEPVTTAVTKLNVGDPKCAD